MKKAEEEEFSTCSSPEHLYDLAENETDKQNHIQLEQLKCSKKDSPDSKSKQQQQKTNAASTSPTLVSSSLNRNGQSNKVSRQKSGGGNSGSKIKATPHLETQTSHEYSFFIQQQKNKKEGPQISPQIRFVMFQFLFTSKQIIL